MNKKQIAAVSIVALLGTVLGYDQLNPQCIAPKMIDYEVEAQQGYSFRIIAPDSDYCVITGAVLTKDDYVRMQNNVGIFTVLDKTSVNTKPTYEYCEIAKWLYNAHTDTYPEIQKRFEKYLLPADCKAVKHVIVLNDTIAFDDNSTAVHEIPEFPLPLLLLTVLIVPAIIYSRIRLANV